MGDDNGGLDRAGHQQVFEQGNAGNIQMVGRLVEQQQVRFFCQSECQHRAFALAARGGGGGAVFIEAEAMQKFRQPRFDGPALAVIMQ